MDEPFELWVRLDSPNFSDEVISGVREASARGLHPDGQARRVVRDGITYHVQSFTDRVYFYELRHLLLYRREDGWIYYVTTVGNGSESGRLYPAEADAERTPLPLRPLWLKLKPKPWRRCKLTRESPSA